jgi:hypothetical protein
MESSFFQQGPTPIVATLANWAPKCNNELETRVRLDFEIPLSDALIAMAPHTIQNAAVIIGNLENAIPSSPISTEFDQTIEIYATPDHTTPLMTLANVKLVNMYIFRPTPKDGPSDATFLTFSTTVKAEMPFGGQLVTWALENIRRTVFFRSFDVQGSLALTDAPDADQPEPTEKKSRKKAA